MSLRFHTIRNYFYRLLGVVLSGIGVFVTLASPLYASEIDIFETPTALSLERGEFQVTSYFYKDGGVLLRLGIGASPYFNLGVIEYFDNLIGVEIKTPEIPHAYAKVRIPLPPGRLTSLDLALGYDAIYRGNFSPFQEKLYGIYGVLTLGVPWFPNKLLSPHYISIGFRYPLIFKMDIPDAFVSILLRFNESIQLASELSNIHFGRSSKYRFLNNTSIVLLLGYGISLKATLQVAGTVNGPGYFDTSTDLGLAFVLGFRNFF